MDSFGDPFGEHDPLGIEDEQQRSSPQPGFDSRGLGSSSSLLGLASHLPADGATGATVKWGPSSSPPVAMAHKTPLGSLTGIAAHSFGTSQPILLHRGSPSVLGDAGQHMSTVPSPTAWLGATEPWGQQQHRQQHTNDPLRQSYRDPQQGFPSSQGPVQQQWAQQGSHQPQQFLQHAMMPIGDAGRTGLVPVSAGIVPGSTGSQGQATPSWVAQGQQQTAAGGAAQDASKTQQWQQEPQQQQQQQGSLPHAPQQLQLEQQPAWPFAQQQPLQEGAAKPAAAGPGKKKASKSSSGSTSKKPASSSAAAAVDFSGLWKPPPQPKEARIPKDPGIDYEDILPQGLDATNTRPLPVPADILQLEDLGLVLSVDTWNNVLDEQDRAQLRPLLPPGLSKQNGSSSGDDAFLTELLSGRANIFFGNPTANLFADIVSGTANPRLRRQQELAIQLRQQLAAAQLRQYHNTQVSTLLQMQRLWAMQLPADASTAERLALWKAAQHGDVGMPSSPRTAAAAAAAGQEEEEDQVVPGETDSDGDAQQQQQHVVGVDGDKAAATAPPAQAAKQPAGNLLADSGTPYHSAAQVQQQQQQQQQQQLAASGLLGSIMPSPPAATAAGMRPASTAVGSLMQASQQHTSAGVASAAGPKQATVEPSAAKASGAKTSATKANRQAAPAAATSKAYPVIGASRQNLYVYEGPVDFSKNLTKRQAAAAAAAALKQQDSGGHDAGAGHG